MVLNRDQILSASDRKREEIQIPEWGGSIFIQEWGGADRDFYENSRYEIIENPETKEVEIKAKKTPRAEIAAIIAALSVVDETGQRIFTEADYLELLKKNPEVVERIAKAAIKINGLAVEEVKKAEANFEETPGESGSSI